jgi:hypothetical protein
MLFWIGTRNGDVVSCLKRAVCHFILDDPGGKTWRPNFGDLFAQGLDSPPEAVAELCLELVSGKTDALTGRYLLVQRDLDEILERADEIVRQDLLTLRIREGG